MKLLGQIKLMNCHLLKGNHTYIDPFVRVGLSKIAYIDRNPPLGRSSHGADWRN